MENNSTVSENETSSEPVLNGTKDSDVGDDINSNDTTTSAFGITNSSAKHNASNSSGPNKVVVVTDKVEAVTERAIISEGATGQNNVNESNITDHSNPVLCDNKENTTNKSLKIEENTTHSSDNKSGEIKIESSSNSFEANKQALKDFYKDESSDPVITGSTETECNDCGNAITVDKITENNALSDRVDSNVSQTHNSDANISDDVTKNILTNSSDNVVSTTDIDETGHNDNSIIANRYEDTASEHRDDTITVIPDVLPSVISTDTIPEQTITPDDDRKDSSDDSDQLLSELDAVLNLKSNKKQHVPSDPVKGSCDYPNGIISSKKTVSWFEYQKIFSQLNQKSQEVERLLGENEELSSELFKATKERDGFSREVRSIKARNVEEIYLTQIKEMENTIATQQNEIKSLKDKLVSHDAAAKRTVAALQNELKLRVDQVTKMYEDCLKEKDSIVMKYAQGEQRAAENQKMIDKLNVRLKESTKEKEKIGDTMKNIKTDRVKVQAAFESKVAECLALTKDLEKQKDSISSCDVKVKWANNKLKAELESHKETKAEVQRLLAKLKQAREETEQIRMNCQEIVKTYQESEEIKSNSLDIELKRKLDELEQQKQEKSDTEEVYQAVKGELDSLKKQYHDTFEELKTMKDKVHCLEDERVQQEATLDKFRDIIQTQKTDNTRLKESLDKMAELEDTLEKEKETVEKLTDKIHQLEESNQDFNSDVGDLKNRETELMNFTEKLSAKNAHLQSENISLNSKVTMATSDIERLTVLVDELEAQNKTVSEELSQGRKRWHDEYESLSDKLTLSKKEVDELTIALEDVRDEIKTLKKRHTANKKDLTRQLQHVKKRLEFYEEDKEKTSMGSRTSSNGSLEKTTEKNTAPPGAPVERSRSQEPPKPEDIPDYEIVEPDKSKIIEKILRLQKAHVRKNEKLEFMEGHVKELLEEVQKKAKIIQSYILREESGTLAPEAMDENKAQLSKKGGIMSSIQSSHVNDSHMTMQLSLQINKKLQAVLEDTILKNITLKENIDTLGSEIARLSGENRNLQLKLHNSN